MKCMTLFLPICWSLVSNTQKWQILLFNLAMLLAWYYLSDLILLDTNIFFIFTMQYFFLKILGDISNTGKPVTRFLIYLVSKHCILTLPLMLKKNRTKAEKCWQLSLFYNNFWVEKRMGFVITLPLSVSNHLEE